MTSKQMPGRTVELGNDDALGAVDDERALRRHQRDFAHVNLLLLGAVLLLELEGDVQRRGEGLAFAHRLADASASARRFRSWRNRA